MRTLNQLDALESSMNSVFQRLDLDSLTEQAERLRLHQEALQKEMARKNNEHNIKISEQIHTRLPHIARKSDEGDSPAPEGHGGISPVRMPDPQVPADQAERAAAAAAAAAAIHPARSASAFSEPSAGDGPAEGKSALSRASLMIQRARLQRTTPASPSPAMSAAPVAAAPAPVPVPVSLPPAPATLDVPELTPALGRASPQAPATPHTRQISPARRDAAASVTDMSFLSQQLSTSNIFQPGVPHQQLAVAPAVHAPGAASYPGYPTMTLAQHAQQQAATATPPAVRMASVSLAPSLQPAGASPVPPMPAPAVPKPVNTVTPASIPAHSPLRMPSLESLPGALARTQSLASRMLPAGAPHDLRTEPLSAPQTATPGDAPTHVPGTVSDGLAPNALRTPSVCSVPSGPAPLAVGADESGLATPSVRSGGAGTPIASRPESANHADGTQKPHPQPLEGAKSPGASASPEAEREKHREELQMAYELHMQQQHRIQEMEQLLERMKSPGAPPAETPGPGPQAAPAGSPSVGDVPMVMEELKKIQKQNDTIAERLMKAEGDARPTTPTSSRKQMTPPRFPPKRRGSLVSNEAPREDALTWSPASTSLRGGMRGGRDAHKPSEFPGLPPPSDSGDDDIDPVAHLIGGRHESASHSSAKYSYTRNALKNQGGNTKVLVGPRKQSVDGAGKQKEYAFGSTVKVKVAVNGGGTRRPSRGRPASQARSESQAAPAQEKPRRVVSPPPNRHRLQQEGGRGAGSQARSHSAGAAGRGWRTAERPPAHEKTPPPVVTRSRSERHWSEERGMPGENRHERDVSPTRLPQADDRHLIDRAGLQDLPPVACLVLPLPNCCRSLPLSDEGLTPRSVARVAQLHLSEVANHYVEWLSTGASPSEMEEAAAILSILPLSSLPSHTFGSVCRAVINLLVDFAALGQDIILYLLRIVRLLCTSRSHERLPQWNVVITVLVDILRHPECVTLIPSAVNSLLAFGTNGLSVLLKEASARPPQHDPCLLEDGAVSSWNSLILTLLVNQPSIVNNIVVPLVLRDLRDGTPERAEAACNALIGLAQYKPKVVPQLGESLTAGRFDRRVSAMAIRMVGGDEGVSLLQALLSHPSHKVRQAAVWGLGLHAPGDFDSNPDFDTLPTDHQPKPPLAKFNARCTSVVHAELASLDVVHRSRLPPPVLYFQPQLTPECPPYIETHIIIDAVTMLQQCSDLARNETLDLSIGALPQTKISDLPQPQDGEPVRYTFMSAAKALAVPSEVDTRTTALFLGTFRPITGGRGVLSPSLVKLQRTLKTLPPAHTTALPSLTRTVVARVVNVLVGVAATAGDTLQEIKVREEALHVLRWFHADDIEPTIKPLTPVLDSNHPTLRSGVVVLLSEVLRRGRERGSTSDVMGMLAARLTDSHPRVRLAAAIALRSTDLPVTLLPMLLHCLRDGKINRYQVAHTVACIVPKGIQALVDATNAQSIEDNTRKACIYGLGRVSHEALHVYPQLNENVSSCLAMGCSDLNAVEIREQALLSLGCVSGVLESPMNPPAVRAVKVRDDQFSDAKRKVAVLLEKACELLHTDELRVRDLAATVLALSGKKGVCFLQEAILKPKVAMAAARLSAVKALPHVPNKATMFKTALLATDDADGTVRCAAHNALFSCPVKAIAADLRKLPNAALHEVKAACSVVLGRTRHTLPSKTVQMIQDLLQQLIR